MARQLAWKVGDRFNDLEFISVDPANNKYGIFLCHACGLQKSMSRDGVKRGRYKSCGCLKSTLISAANTKHGFASDFYQDPGSTYFSWDNIPKDFCCPAWANYEAFLADMGERPPGTELGRFNLAEPYSPENCVWATESEISSNRGLFKNNSSGFKGVSWRSREKVWIAEVCKDYQKHQQRFPGTPTGLRNAVAWVRAKREELHGLFANHGDQPTND